MADELIVELFAQKGKNYDETGQAIASYGRSHRNSCLFRPSK